MAIDRAKYATTDATSLVKAPQPSDHLQARDYELVCRVRVVPRLGAARGVAESAAPQRSRTRYSSGSGGNAASRMSAVVGFTISLRRM